MTLIFYDEQDWWCSILTNFYGTDNHRRLFQSYFFTGTLQFCSGVTVPILVNFLTKFYFSMLGSPRSIWINFVSDNRYSALMGREDIKNSLSGGIRIPKGKLHYPGIGSISVPAQPSGIHQEHAESGECPVSCFLRHLCLAAEHIGLGTRTVPSVSASRTHHSTMLNFPANSVRSR